MFCRCYEIKFYFLTSLSASFIFVIPFPIKYVLTTSSWYWADPRDFFVDKLLVYLWGSPLRCFSKLSFLTHPVPSIQLLLNHFMFFILVLNWIQSLHLFLLLFPIQLSYPVHIPNYSPILWLSLSLSFLYFLLLTLKLN